MSARASLRYTESYKKREAAEQDPYAMRRSPKEPAICPTCDAVYTKKRWTTSASMASRLRKDPKAVRVVCPACRKIRDRYPEGILTLTWSALQEREADIRGLIAHEQARVRRTNPLQRVMRIVRRGGGMEVETTTDHLAQRLGRALVRAFHGRVEYQWAHKDKFARVNWQGPVVPKKA
jgi:NMD protein affecting ribosome stability and mRNA decay